MQHLYPRLLCQHSTWLKHQTVNQPEPKYILTEYLTRILDVSFDAVLQQTSNWKNVLFFRCASAINSGAGIGEWWCNPTRISWHPTLPRSWWVRLTTSANCVPLCPSVLLDFLSNLKLTIVFCVFAVNSIWRCICQSYFSFFMTVH